MDTFAHDGSAWRKARHIYQHDGVTWRKAREIWVASPTWRCVYQDREFVELASVVTSGVNSVRSNSSWLLVASNLGAYTYNGTWNRLGTLTNVLDFIDVGGTLYCCTSSDVFRWDGASWVAAGSTSRPDRYSLGESAGKLIAMTSGGSTYVLNGSTWSVFGVQLFSSFKCPANGVNYGINYGTFLYNVDSLSLISDSGDFFGHLHVYPKAADAIYVDGTGGLKKWNGSSWISLSTADHRVLMSQDDRGDVIVCPTGTRRCSRRNASDAEGPVGDSSLKASWSNTGRPRSALYAGILFVAMDRTSPTRTTVHEFRLK